MLAATKPPDAFKNSRLSIDLSCAEPAGGWRCKDACLTGPFIVTAEAGRAGSGRSQIASDRFQRGDLFGHFEGEGFHVGVEELALALRQFVKELRERSRVTGRESRETGGIGHAAAQPHDLRD